MNNPRFKAWDKKSKVMRHVITRIDWLIDGRPIRCYWCTSEIENGVLKEGEFILLQFTGRSDKNGVELYAGDIIKHDVFVGVVKWDDDYDGFICEYINWNGRAKQIGSKIEHLWNNRKTVVIGNRFENEELLEKK